MSDSSDTLEIVDSEFPTDLRATKPRQPFERPDMEQLVAVTLPERQSRRLAELDRYTGDVTIPVPPMPQGKPPPRRSPNLPPEPDAVGGIITPVRNVWIAKYATDVFGDFEWGSPAAAIDDPWIHSERMRGVDKRIGDVAIGDLVIPMRTQWEQNDNVWLKRRCLVGLWAVEAIASFPIVTSAGKRRTVYEVACQPIKRFTFPVPIDATSDQDKAFSDVVAFHDRARLAFMGLTADDAVAVARNCGLPATILTEPDPDRLVAITLNCDLGPPTAVRRRILEGARAAAHRKSVELSARDIAVAGLRRNCFGVASTERERGLGSDLLAEAIEHDGSKTVVRTEVKGLSGSDPWEAVLTRSEYDAAVAARRGRRWWLVIVTNALRDDRKAIWLTADEVAQIYSMDGHERAVADQSVAHGLASGH